jgi:hypothetical protein
MLSKEGKTESEVAEAEVSLDSTRLRCGRQLNGLEGTDHGFYICRKPLNFFFLNLFRFGGEIVPFPRCLACTGRVNELDLI